MHLLSRAVGRLAIHNARRTPAALSATYTPAALSHTLQVPSTTIYVTPFENGIPVEQVRSLAPVEKKWDFWTTSDAFAEVKPTLGGYSHVPYGEVWIVGSGSSAKVVKEGDHFFVPFVGGKVVAIKNTNTISMGVISPSVSSADGQSVNAYAVVYIKVTDFVKSALYVDPETNQRDSERAVAKLVKRVLEQEVPKLTVGNSATLSASNVSILSDKITTSLKARADEFGIEVEAVELRGAFPVSVNLADKLRALDPPLHLPETPGHGLSADYWAEVLTPPYFQKYKFGSEKEVVTPATVSLEWSIPSPPDYHHFNMIPRVTADPPATSDKKVAKAH